MSEAGYPAAMDVTYIILFGIAAICFIGMFTYVSPEEKRKREIENLEHEKRVTELKRTIKDAQGEQAKDAALEEYEQYLERKQKKGK